MNVPDYAQDLQNFELTYLVSINSDKSYNCHYLRDDRVAVLRECNTDGTLVDLKKKSDSQPWVLLHIKEFYDNGETFEIPVCQKCCPVMGKLSKVQKKSVLTSQLCHHSRILTNIVRDYKNPFYLDNWLSLTDEVEKGFKIEILLKKENTSCSSHHLAIAFDKKKIGIIWTQGRMITPSCSLCSSKKCKHYHQWHRKIEEEKGTKKNDKNNDDNDDDNDKPDPHYNNTDDENYGFNRSEIHFPLLSEDKQKSAYEARTDGRYGLPDEIVPPYDPDIKCKHGRSYSQSSLKLISEALTIFNDHGDTVVSCKVFGRLSPCRCLLNPDLHEYLLLNMGEGRCVDYETLQKHLILFCRTGCTSQGFFKNVESHCKLMGKPLFTEYQIFLRAMHGYVKRIKWKTEEIFSCPNCGISPAYLVGDGKCDIAPLQRRIPPGVKELSSNPSDPSPVLKQASFHSSRVFLQHKFERDMIISLLQGTITISDVIKSRKAKSENFKLIVKILERIKDQAEIPSSYVDLLVELSKNSPVAGILQITQKKTLKFLRDFCVKATNVRDASHHQTLQLLISELPTFFPVLIQICDLEGSEFLPHDVSRVVIALIKIRLSTFADSEQRFSDDYIPYDGGEDCTQFYPNHPIHTWPKLYNVGSSTDKDSCDKNFSSHSQFVDGIFSIGCACKYSITYGFELMLHSESPRHFFHFLTSRAVNFNHLRGVIFDFACGLHRYILNREPAQFETVQFLVDGSHWNGHSSCAEGYNFNRYKSDNCENSQNREQLHSTLSKLGKSLRQMSYSNFMRYCVAFFAISNLSKLNKI